MAVPLPPLQLQLANSSQAVGGTVAPAFSVGGDAQSGITTWLPYIAIALGFVIALRVTRRA